MLRRIGTYIRRNHLALLALFFALGGASLAAGSRLLPENSVGTKQVINGSLQTRDLSGKAQTILKGKRGRRGPIGGRGATGMQGIQGIQGMTGIVSDAYEMRAPGDFDVTMFEKALGVTVPAGSYVVTGKAEEVNRDSTDVALLRCSLSVEKPGGKVILDQMFTTGLPMTISSQIYGHAANIVQGSFTTTDATVLEYSCIGLPFAKDVWVSNPSLSVLKVGAIH